MLGWLRGFDAFCTSVRLEREQLGEALTRPQLGEATWLARG